MFSPRTASLLLVASFATFSMTPSFAGYAMPAPEIAADSTSNWYLGLFLGGIAPDKSRYFNSVTGDTYSTTYKPTYDVGFNFGYRASTFRFEGQYTFADVRVKKITNLTNGVVTTPPNLDIYGLIPDPGIRGRLKSTFIMGNMYYDFQGQNEAFGYYLGLGAGMANLTAKILTASTHFSGGFVEDIEFKATENKFAYQGMFGMNYNPGNHYLYDLGFRYLATAKLNKLANKSQHFMMLNVGLTYMVPV